MARRWQFKSSIVVPAIGAALLVSAGCSTVETRAVGSMPPGAAGGIQYYLATSRMQVDVLKNTDEANPVPRYTIRLGTPVASPDTGFRYAVNYAPSAFSDERICVARAENGLLKSVQFISSDRTGDIAIKAAETAATFGLGFPSGVPLRVQQVVLGPDGTTLNADALFNLARDRLQEEFLGLFESDKARAIYSASFELHSTTDEARLNQEISKVLQVAYRRELMSALDAIVRESGKTMSISPKMVSKAQDMASKAEFVFKLDVDDVFSNTQANGCDNSSANGICYRMRTKVPISVSAGEKSSVLPLLDREVIAIDPSTTTRIDVNRAFLIQKATKIEFTDGELTAMNISTPSQFWSAAKLPLQGVKAVLEAPASFFTTIAKAFSSETAAINANINLMKAAGELQKSRAPSVSIETINTVQNDNAPPVTDSSIGGFGGTQNESPPKIDVSCIDSGAE